MTNPKLYMNVTRKPVSVIWKAWNTLCPFQIAKLDFKSVRSLTAWLQSNTPRLTDTITIYDSNDNLVKHYGINRHAVNKALSRGFRGEVPVIINGWTGSLSII